MYVRIMALLKRQVRTSTITLGAPNVAASYFHFWSEGNSVPAFGYLGSSVRQGGFTVDAKGRVLHWYKIRLSGQAGSCGRPVWWTSVYGVVTPYVTGAAHAQNKMGDGAFAGVIATSGFSPAGGSVGWAWVLSHGPLSTYTDRGSVSSKFKARVYRNANSTIGNCNSFTAALEPALWFKSTSSNDLRRLYQLTYRGIPIPGSVRTNGSCYISTGYIQALW